MDITFLEANIKNPNVLIPEIKNHHKTCFSTKIYEDFDPKNHKVNNKRYRRDKNIMIPDPTGATETNGDPKLVPYTEKVNRIALPLQELITIRGNAFLTGGGITFKSNPDGEPEKKTLEKFKEIWKRNKCDFKNSEIGSAIYSETECAEIWYSRKNEDGTFEIKCNIYKPSDGYELIPIYDNNQDMIAFAKGYEIEKNKKTIKCLDLYTKDFLYFYISTDGDWLLKSEPSLVNPAPLLYGKLPVVYYSTKKAIWENVQPLIERLETLISNFGDTNDYNGSPILAASGTIKGFSAKGETGKVVELEENATLKYVSWDNAPESIKLEKDILIEFIYTATQTPNFSFDKMLGLGKFSGVAFDRILIDPHLKAKNMQDGIYGEGIQRRCNFLISAITELYKDCKQGKNLDITPEFGMFKIDDQADKIDMLQKANGGLPLISHKESIEANGMSDDVDATLKEIKDSAIEPKTKTETKPKTEE